MPAPVDNTVPAGNTGNLLMNLIYGQQSDPAQQMADWTRTNQARNRVAAGMDLSGNLLPAPAPGTLPGVGSGQITGPPQDPTAAMATLQQTGTLSPSQTPNAYKSDNTMGSMIIALQRRQEAAAGLQQSLGLAGAAISRPENRERVFKTFAPGPQGNPVELGQGLMNLASQTQGQDRTNAIGQMIMDPVRGPALASSLNFGSWEQLKAAFQADPANIGKIVSDYNRQTEPIKGLEQINTYIGQVKQRDPQKTPEVLAMIRNAMLAGMGGAQAEAAIGDAVAYKARTGKDAPWVVNGSVDQRAYAQFTANEQQKENERGVAAHVLADNQNSAEELRGNLEKLREMPGLKTILADQVKREAASKALNDNTYDLPGAVARGILTNDEAAAVALLRRIGGASTATALHSLVGTGTRVTQQEVGPLKDSITTTQNLNQDYDTYVHNAINPFITKIKKTVANAYGASGNVNHMDPEYEPWLHPIYRKGGELFKEGGGADAIPNLQPITPDKLAWAKNEVKAYPAGKDDALDSLQQEGFDVSRLRNTDPSKW